MRRGALLALLTVCCVGIADDDIDLPPRTFDDDDAGGDDDSGGTVEPSPCGAPDAAPPYLSPFRVGLLDLLPEEDARALGYALDVSAFGLARLVPDAFELTVQAFVADGCPARENTTTELDPDPRCSEIQRNTLAASSYSGGCVGSCDFEVTGSAGFSLRRLECTAPGGGELVERTKGATGAGLDIGALARHLGGVSRFGFDGRVDHTLRRERSRDGGTLHEEWAVDTTFTALPGPPKGFLSDLFRQGSGTARLEGAADARLDAGGAIIDFTRRVSGSVITAGISRPWEAILDVEWSTGDGGCALEPTRGTVRGRSYDAPFPAGVPVGDVSIVYDGDKECDGCGVVYSAGVAVGSACVAPLPSPPASPPD